MIIIGCIQVKGSSWELEEFGKLYDRLRHEVKGTGRLSRYIGYASERDEMRFFGIEVERLEEIPEGMVAWEMTDSEWTVTSAQHGAMSIVWQAALSWVWRDQPTSGRTVGEFEAACHPEWVLDEHPAAVRMHPTTNAYIGLDVEADDDSIHLVEYNPDWPGQFDTIAARLKTELGSDLALKVEHYGSTSVPGLCAKPVIDVLVEVPSFEEARRRAIPVFNLPEWEYWAYSNHMIFIGRNRLMGQRTHHVHLAPRGHEIWKGLAFRDYLRAHPEEAARYAKLKRELAESHGTDRERYTEAKTEYVQEVTARADCSENSSCY
jgi:GrpB-like predicted nucleotidyltransferase (UPF0157 family)